MEDMPQSLINECTKARPRPPCFCEVCVEDRKISYKENQKWLDNYMKSQISKCGCIGQEETGHGFSCELSQIREKPEKLSYLNSYYHRMKDVVTMEEHIDWLGTLNQEIKNDYYKKGYYNGRRECTDENERAEIDWKQIWNSLKYHPRASTLEIGLVEHPGLYLEKQLEYQWSRPVLFAQLVIRFQDLCPTEIESKEGPIEDMPDDIMDFIKLCVFKVFPSAKENEDWDILKKQYNYAQKMFFG